MLDDLKNRAATPETKRGPGRPKEAAAPATEAQVLPPMSYVPPMLCPHCGQGMTPRVLRGLPNGDRKCQCSQCGKHYVFTPAKTRRLV